MGSREAEAQLLASEIMGLKPFRAVDKCSHHQSLFRAVRLHTTMRDVVT